MKIDSGIASRFEHIDWFGCSGRRLNEGIPLQWKTALNLEEAVTSAQSVLWQDVKTHAQGELTGYLAKHGYEEYSTFWNKLIRAYREQIQRETMPYIVEALKRMRAEPLAEDILLDLIRIGVHTSYKKQFHHVPDFFQRLLLVYECGRLPCGWTSSLDSWPEGQMLIY